MSSVREWNPIFRHAFADFFIGAVMFDWKHLEVWLNRFSNRQRMVANKQ